jgi:hypothetical protein
MVLMFDPAIPRLDTSKADRNILQGELDQLKKQFSSFDEAYVANACFEERRRVLDEAYEVCKLFLDDGFLREVSKPGKFMDRLWELALCSILLHEGYVLEKWSKTNKSRPDFCVLLNGKKIWIEAACPDLGDVDPVAPPPVLIPGVIHSETIDIAQDVRPRALRASSALKTKFAKREAYLKGGHMSEKDAYVIAINTHRITRHADSMLEELVLYGMGLHQFNLRTRDSSRQWKPEAFKNGGDGTVSVPMAYLLRPEYKTISGVIFHSKWFEFGTDWKNLLAASTTFYFNEGADVSLERKEFSFGKRKYMEMNGSQGILREL